MMTNNELDNPSLSHRDFLVELLRDLARSNSIEQLKSMLTRGPGGFKDEDIRAALELHQLTLAIAWLEELPAEMCPEHTAEETADSFDKDVAAASAEFNERYAGKGILEVLGDKLKSRGAK